MSLGGKLTQAAANGLVGRFLQIRPGSVEPPGGHVKGAPIEADACLDIPVWTCRQQGKRNVQPGQCLGRPASAQKNQTALLRKYAVVGVRDEARGRVQSGQPPGEVSLLSLGMTKADQYACGQSRVLGVPR